MPDRKRHVIDPAIRIEIAAPADRAWIVQQLTTHWGAVEISSLGVWHSADALPALVAWRADRRVGLATHTPPIPGGGCEVITLSSAAQDSGVGTALLVACVETARRAGCRRVFLTTTNDNLRALGFYQRRAWRLVAVHRGAMDLARVRKPTIPLIGMNNIPLRDEIELEIIL